MFGDHWPKSRSFLLYHHYESNLGAQSSDRERHLMFGEHWPESGSFLYHQYYADVGAQSSDHEPDLMFGDLWPKSRSFSLYKYNHTDVGHDYHVLTPRLSLIPLRYFGMKYVHVCWLFASA